jgi:phage tail-like protein
MRNETVPAQQAAFGMAMRFNVVVDGISLGNWSSCKGLEFKCKPVKFHEHGSYEFERILFVDVSYEMIKLERAVDRVASAQLREWLTNELNNPPGTQLFGAGKTATITLLDAAWNPVTSWTLRGVYPAGWSGPSLSAKESAVATERLDLWHEGFM